MPRKPRILMAVRPVRLTQSVTQLVTFRPDSACPANVYVWTDHRPVMIVRPVQGLRSPGVTHEAYRLSDPTLVVMGRGAAHTFERAVNEFWT